MDLSRTPAAAPPPGVVPNLDNPTDLSVVSIVVPSIMIFLTIVFVSGRLIQNVKIGKRWGLDDYSAIVALALSITFSGLTIQQSYLFRHQWDIPLSWFDDLKAKCSFSTDTILGPATFFAKVSVLLFYVRIFSAKVTSRSLKNQVNILLVFCFLLYWANVPLEFVMCLPRKGQSWSDFKVLERCAQSLPFAIVQGTLNVLVDIWLLYLPLPIILNLHLPTKKKLWVAGIFATGILGIAASLLGLVYRVKINYDTDTTWDQNILFLAIMFEMDAAIICSCMPKFASLLRLLIVGDSGSAFDAHSATYHYRKDGGSGSPHKSGGTFKMDASASSRSSGPDDDTLAFIEVASGHSVPLKTHITGGVHHHHHPSRSFNGSGEMSPESSATYVPSSQEEHTPISPIGIMKSVSFAARRDAV